MKNTTRILFRLVLCLFGFELTASPLNRQLAPIMEVVEEEEAWVDLEAVTIEEFTQGIDALMEDFYINLEEYINGLEREEGLPRADDRVQAMLRDLIMKLGVVQLEIQGFDCLESTKQIIRALILEQASTARAVVNLPTYQDLKYYLNPENNM